MQQTSRAILLAGVFAVAPLAAQQDTTMMQHDSTMMDHGHMMDSSSMSHDRMMGHDSAMGMGANMMFMGAEGQKAAGDYEVSEAGGKPKLELTDDFAVAEAPDLYLVLANGDTPDKGALYLGKLKQAKGGQTYDLPKGKEMSKYTKLLVWSKKEKRTVASAEWHPTAGGAMNHM
jgi:hypothetical protein